jgi:hypothetical protein
MSPRPFKGPYAGHPIRGRAASRKVAQIQTVQGRLELVLGPLVRLGVRSKNGEARAATG